MTDVRHMGVIANLLINYLNFFIKGGHNRKGGGGGVGQDKKKGICSGTYLYWTYIGVPPPPPECLAEYIFTKIVSRSLST